MPAPQPAPTLDRFASLAKTHTVVPVWRELLADTLTPVSAFLALVGDGPGFLLESVEGGEHWGRYSWVGRRPVATLVVRGASVEVEGRLAAAVPLDRGALGAVEGVLGAYRSPKLAELPPLHGGLVGYLGYDVAREVERLPDVPPDDQGYPDAVVSVIGQLAAFDRWRQRVVLIDNVVVEPAWGRSELVEAWVAAGERLERMALELVAGGPAAPVAGGPGSVPGGPVSVPGGASILVAPPVAGEALPEVRRTMSTPAYCAAVEVAREHIFAGDIFQVVLSQRFDLDLGADPFDVYRVLRQVNPSPYMYFLRHPCLSVVGSSPEPMVRLLDNKVVSRPIAGTRRRGGSEAHDAQLAAELIEDPKERSEHVMLVDLARNDVGRVVDYGTEVVDEMMTLERYSHVMHLTSQVSGALRAGLGPVDVLRATLPAGTLSGAPKVRAMQIIDSLEPTKRGPYGGVVGYLDFSGNLDTAIAIRTMLVSPDGRASVQAGAGIVVGSDPVAEDAECQAKAAALLAAVPAARRMTAARRH